MSQVVANLDCALTYAGQGLRIIPIFEVKPDGSCACGSPECTSPGKHPRISSWPTNASASELQVRNWFLRHPNANIGIATGRGLFVVDIDVGPTKDGRQTLDELIERYGPLPPTLTVRTGSGGLHLYFRAPEGFEIKTAAGTLGPGIDTRGEGGYVVAPPSLHASGNRYERIDPCQGIAMAPEWLLDLCRKGRQPQPAATGEMSFMQPGRRNNDLAILAGALRRRGYDEQHLHAALKAVNAQTSVPLPEQEVASVARSIGRYPLPLVPENLTEQSVAEILADRLLDRFSYCPEFKWSGFKDGLWRPVAEEIEVQEEAKQLVKAIKQDFDHHLPNDLQAAKMLKVAVRACQRRPYIKNIVELCKSDPRIAVSHDDFNRNKTLFNVGNGTLDLLKSELRPHSPADLITKKADVDFDPDATCPTFDAFIEQVLPGPTGRYALRAIAYSMLGTLEHQCLFILVGEGRNGKSTLLELMLSIFGGYGVNTDVDTFLRRDGANYELARLDGARLIVTSEAPNGGILNAPLIKRFTGNDTITARPIYKPPFEYRPAGVIFMATNHLPVIDGGDYGLTRRMRIVPFQTRIQDQDVDPDLSRRLLAERSGILNRLLAALAEYREIGLAEPEDVLRHTAQYADDSDTLKAFLDEKCEDQTDGAGISAQVLYDMYRGYCMGSGLKPLTMPSFKRALETKGYTHKRKNAGYVWQGLQLRTNWPGAEAA